MHKQSGIIIELLNNCSYSCTAFQESLKISVAIPQSL